MLQRLTDSLVLEFFSKVYFLAVFCLRSRKRASQAWHSLRCAVSTFKNTSILRKSSGPRRGARSGPRQTLDAAR
jgi:hypothetical protein